MTSTTKGQLIVIKDLCKDHEHADGFICGSVVQWDCRGCRKQFRTNPHYAQHNEYLCNNCQMRGFQ